MTKYKTLIGMNYEGKRVEADTIIEDLPSKSLPWLVEQGLVEKVEGESSKREPKSPSEGDE
jgi:hypothetical protein